MDLKILNLLIIIIMFKIFFITFFIAELIIALAVILKIYSFNKYINNLNDKVSASKKDIKYAFMEARVVFKRINRIVLKLKEIIKQKREEYLLRILKTSVIYGFILLNKKYRRMIFTYQIFKEVYAGIQEV